jgi:BlaI family penicillinase repressor
VHDLIASARPIGYTTVLKQMQVMHRKGLVSRVERYRSHVYQARQSRMQTQRQLAGMMLRQVFQGSAHGLLQSALAGRKVGREELAEIRKLLEDHERRSK